MSTLPTVTFRKTTAGWRLFSTVQIPAGFVSVRKADGTTKTLQITGTGASTPGGFLYSFEDSGQSHDPLPRRTARGAYRAGERPIRGCADCRRLDRMCKQCLFDEYDM